MGPGRRPATPSADHGWRRQVQHVGHSGRTDGHGGQPDRSHLLNGPSHSGGDRPCPARRVTADSQTMPTACVICHRSYAINVQSPMQDTANAICWRDETLCAISPANGQRSTAPSQPRANRPIIHTNDATSSAVRPSEEFLSQYTAMNMTPPGRPPNSALTASGSGGNPSVGRAVTSVGDGRTRSGAAELLHY